jgi:hypothetical protein
VPRRTAPGQPHATSHRNDRAPGVQREAVERAGCSQQIVARERFADPRAAPAEPPGHPQTLAACRAPRSISATSVALRCSGEGRVVGVEGGRCGVRPGAG